jgi:hypothetical protein
MTFTSMSRIAFDCWPAASIRLLATTRRRSNASISGEAE